MIETIGYISFLTAFFSIPFALAILIVFFIRRQGRKAVKTIFIEASLFLFTFILWSIIQFSKVAIISPEGKRTDIYKYVINNEDIFWLIFSFLLFLTSIIFGIYWKNKNKIF